MFMAWADDVRRRIREIREDRDIKQFVLAEALGYSKHSTVSRMERGEVKLAIDQLPVIADALGVPVERLVVPDRESALMDAVKSLDAAARERLFIFIQGLLAQKPR